VTTLRFCGSTAPHDTSGVSSTASSLGKSLWYLAEFDTLTVRSENPNEPVRDPGGRAFVLDCNAEDRRSVGGDAVSRGELCFIEVGDANPADVDTARLTRFERAIGEADDCDETTRCLEASGLCIGEDKRVVGDDIELGGTESSFMTGESSQVRCRMTDFVAHYEAYSVNQGLGFV
jgi:hypothetical protein